MGGKSGLAGFEILEACIAEQIEVPDEVAVLGMLNMPVFRKSTTIPLSSVMVDHKTVTGAACDLLARMMDGEAPPTEPILFPPRGIAARRSTNTIAADHAEVARAVRFMLDHYMDPIGVREITRRSGACRTRLYELFAAEFQKTPGDVLAGIRIDKAKQMLTQSTAKIGTISESCGFGDPVNLYRNFKRHLGVSPAAYREGQISHDTG